MGQYRLSIYARWQIGFLISIRKEQIIIDIAFIKICIATTKYAYGNNIFRQ